MYKIKIYDNGGKTMDRYGVIINSNVFTMSSNPNSPQGINQYVCRVEDIAWESKWAKEFIGDFIGEFKTTTISDMFDTDIPREVLLAICNRLDAVIELPCYGIKVSLKSNEFGEMTGVIESELKEQINESEATDQEKWDNMMYNVAIDTLESLILSHAYSGVDINSPAYIDGIETTVDKIMNEYP